MATNAPPVETVESPVRVTNIGEDTVQLDLPEDSMDCDRVIPRDLIDMGRDARNWFLWDQREKQPRAPMTNAGYAGPCQWGRDNVSWDSRAGSRFSTVVDELNGEVTGHISESWSWPDDEDPRELIPMCIVPHSDFQPDPPLLLVDLDDVIDPETGEMSREAWDIIESLGGFAEVSRSVTGAHVLVRGRLPKDLDVKKVIEDLDSGGQVEMYGFPADGRIIGTTWIHINETPRNSVPHVQDSVDSIINEYVDDEQKLSEEEQAQRVLEQRTSGLTESGSDRSAYYDINPVPIAQTGAFPKHSCNGQGPHPVHGGTTTPDEDSTNFGVSRSDGWKCFAHDSGGGSLQLIAVLEGIRDCRHASDVMSDPVDAMTVCLAARDEYTDGELDSENPPTVALKGVAEVLGLDPPEDNPLPRHMYRSARDVWNKMQYDGDV